jgi:glyoxylase-like metal-dependent hydrolase (beta-lactamase superfamily II)
MMNRRQFLVISSTGIAAAPFGTLLRAQAPQPPAPQPRFEAIRRNVGYFTARGGTIGWLINKDSVVTVDTQFPDTAKLCLEGLRERAAGRGIDIAFNTHHHGDHTSGNPLFKEVAKKLVAHVRVPDLQRKAAAQTQPTTTTASNPLVVADVTFDKTWGESAGDERVSAKHHGPGHTGGDAVIHFERAEVVHMGDLFFHEMHPRVDRPSGASIQNWMKTIETVTKEMPADAIYIAGHARAGLPVTTGSKELLRLRDYFDAVLTHVRQAIAKGQSKEEVAKLPALRGFESHQSSGTMLTLAGVLGVAYEELTAK